MNAPPLVLGDALLTTLEKLIEETPDIDRLRRVARVLHYSSSYLHEHDPRGDHQYGKFPCSGEGYHRCSYSGRHDVDCKTAGGSGDVSANGFKNARSCEPDCAEGDAEPWCHCSGFDCPDCESVATLNGILAEAAA